MTLTAIQVKIGLFTIAIVGGFLCADLFDSPAVHATASALATPVREADAACGRCHAAIVKSYLATPMANASGRAAENLHTGAFVHTASTTEFTISAPNKQPVLSYRSTGATEPGERLALTYFLGSGHLGTTYLYSIGDFLFESPIAWYGPSNGFDMKPGLAELVHVPPPLPMQSECLRCHMSSVQPSAPGTINRYDGPAFLHTGITCEACHGDSKSHLDARGKAGILNPDKLSADLRDSICISCHLEGDVSVERAGRSAMDYHPGKSISSFVAFYVKRGAGSTDRGVSEVEQLAKSVCKRTSGDRMSCTSCHDPHYTPSPAQKAAFFRNKCLACHNQPEFARTHHAENQDCTSCHMPRTGAENIPHVAWTDHRILALPEEATKKLARSVGDELTPVFSPGATSRDLAMANYKALLLGDRSREPFAWQELNSERNLIANDKAALDALGVLSAERGDLKEAEEVFRRLLALNADDLTALSDLGVLLAKEGKLKESVSLLNRAFSKNQDIPGLSMNLARVECTLGDGEAARQTLTIALKYSGGLEDIRRLLAQMGSCGNEVR
jgi:predicted CXXCH cytochrome family protein